MELGYTRADEPGAASKRTMKPLGKCVSTATHSSTTPGTR
jgi:hypothetical protein